LKPFIPIFLLGMAAATVVQADVLYDNGPVVDASHLSVRAPSATTISFGAQTKSNNALAEDFTVGGAGWLISSIDFFAVQNNALAFTLQTVSWAIMSGDVNNGSVLASGATTLTNAGLEGYRVTSTTLSSKARPIYRANADIEDVKLDAGQYWLRWSMTGSLSSGPWGVPTSDGVAGNAAQSIAGSSFTTIIDEGSVRGISLPFVLQGSMVSAVPEPAGLLLMLLGGITVVVATRRRASQPQ